MKTKTLEFIGKRQAGYRDRNLNEPSNGEIIVRNRYSLVSPGTELALYTGDHIGFSDPEITWARYPLDIGYSSVGEVVDSRNNTFPEGNIVLHYGTHSPISLLDKNAIKALVPKNLGEKEACFGRFAQIAYSSVAACTREPDNVLVYGAGIIGNLAAQWFVLEKASTVVVRDLSNSRMEKARLCGLTTDPKLLASPETPPQTIIEATGVPAVVQKALDEVAISGQVVLLGSTRGSMEINVYKQIHRKALVVSGAHETVLGKSANAVLDKALNLLGLGELKVAPLITHIISPEELPGIYEHLLNDPDEYLGVLVDWSSWND